MKLLHANVCADRYDYKHDWPKRRPAFVKAVRANAPTVVTLTECQEAAAETLAQLLSDLGYMAVSFQGSSILYDSRQLVLTRVLDRRRWLGGSQTHALLAVEFQNRRTRRRTNVLVSHLPPFAWRAKLRRQQQAQIDALVSRWQDPTVLATDANTRNPAYETATIRSWASARLAAAHVRHQATRTSGHKWGVGPVIDYVLLKRPAATAPAYSVAKLASYDVLNARAWSDHNSLLVELEGR